MLEGASLQRLRENMSPTPIPSNFFIRVALIFLFIILSLGTAQLIILGILYTGYLPDDVSKWNSLHILISVFIQAVVFLSFLAFINRRFSLPIYSFQGDAKLRDIALSFLGLILVNLFSSQLMKLIGVEVNQFAEFNIDLLKDKSYAFLISTVVLAPLYEEVVFRGFILRTLVANQEKNTRRVVLANFVTSLFFAAIHWDVQAALPILILSLYLCALTLYKKSIRLSIITHSLQNLFASIYFLYYAADVTQLV